MVLSARDFAKLESPERKALQNIDDFLGLVRSLRWRNCADIGCGIGFYTLPMAEQWKNSRSVIAVDRSTPALEELEKRIENLELGNVEIRQTVSDRIPIEDASMDLVNLGNVYHEIKGRLNFLKEIYRVLKPGGTLLIIDWDPEVDLGFGPPAHQRISRKQILQDLEFGGFKDVKNHSVFVGHYALTARRPERR
ncbi:MAG: class I SAM-dependent methyltransferase [bacterium]|nr:MAG: class I SAM-dependent methyltransferase [bacterium]